MKYTIEDKRYASYVSSVIEDMMRAVRAMDASMGAVDQTTMQCVDTMMIKAYNTLHEYVMYRDQRMREEEAQDGVD